jgi:hypothetical protein
VRPRALYVQVGAVGIAIMIQFSSVLPRTPTTAPGFVIAIIGWIGLALHVLMRMLPSEFWPDEKRPKPRWMQRVGIFNVVCLFALGGGIATMAGFV